MKSLIIFILGAVCGILGLVVYSCMVVGKEADEEARRLWEEKLREEEKHYEG